MDFRLPDWVQEASQTIGIDLNYIMLILAESYTHTKEMKKAKVGFLLKEIFDRFRDKAMSRLMPDRSLWLYTAHDFTIFSVLNTLGVPQVNRISYYADLDE